MMHEFDKQTSALWDDAIALARQRRAEPYGLQRSRPRHEIEPHLAGAITADGLGGEEALRLFRDVIATSSVAGDHQRFFAFIGHAPSEVAVIGDMLVSAFPIYGGDWLEGAGAIQAENEALAWLAGLAGFPAGSGGCFVSGGTLGNLSALHVARENFRRLRPDAGAKRLAIVASSEAHSSVLSAARILDVDVIEAPVAPGGKLTGALLSPLLAEHGNRVCAVVASAGTTNLGTIDDLESVGQVCNDDGVWLHIDGCYGLAAIASPAARPLFAGIERCDSFTVDPHKWLFSTYDCCALVYRDPAQARAAHIQEAAYLDVLHEQEMWNPADYGIHLSRRARGVPFWFSLAVNGTDAYARGIDQTMDTTRAAADEIRSRTWLRLLAEPELSVVAFQRCGWDRNANLRWSQQLLAEGLAFVVPTTVAGEPALRLAIQHPRTTRADITAVLDTLARA